MRFVKLALCVSGVILVFVCPPFAAACFGAETLFVAIDETILSFDAAGERVGSAALTDRVLSVSADEWGRIYATSLAPDESRAVKWFDPAGEPLGTFATVGPPGSTAMGLAFDRQDRLYVGVNSFNDTVERIAPDGTHLGVFATSSFDGSAASFELDFDADGNLYMPAGHRVERFDTQGNSLGFFAAVDAQTNIWDLDFDSGGDLYVLTSSGAIQSFAPTGEPLGTIVQVDSFLRMAIDSSDVIYVSTDIRISPGATAGSEIWRFSTDGTPLGRFEGDLPTEGVGLIFDLEFRAVVPEPTGFALVFSLFGVLIVSSLVVRWRGRT